MSVGKLKDFCLYVSEIQNLRNTDLEGMYDRLKSNDMNTMEDRKKQRQNKKWQHFLKPGRNK